MNMKKILATILCAAMMLSMTLPALAEKSSTKSLDFCYISSQTQSMVPWTSESVISEGRTWNFEWTSATNISATCRAVVRILTAGGASASSLWVYKTKSTLSHPYNPDVENGQAEVHPAGRLDNRDTGTLTADGTFWN